MSNGENFVLSMVMIFLSACYAYLLSFEVDIISSCVLMHTDRGSFHVERIKTAHTQTGTMQGRERESAREKKCEKEKKNKSSYDKH